MNYQNINLNELYKLPMLIKLFVCLAIAITVLVMVYFLLLSGDLARLTQAEEREETLRSEYEDKARMAAGLNGLQEELKQIQAAFGALLKQLPTESDTPNLIKELHQAAATSGIMNLELMRSYPPSAEGQIERLSYRIVVRGNYEQIARFASNLGLSSRIVILDQLHITQDITEKTKDEDELILGTEGKLILGAVVNTYRVIETDVGVSEAKEGGAK